MGQLLDELLDEIKPFKNDEQLMTLCENIYNQEKENIKDIDKSPTGPNIFLSLEIPGKLKDDIHYITIERELKNKFLVGMWKYNSNNKLIRYGTYPIKEVTPEKRIKEFAVIYKYKVGKI